MKEIRLNMTQQEKYEVIKKLVDTKGNKLNAAIKLGVSKRTINRMIAKYKEFGKEAFVHGNHGRKTAKALDSEIAKTIVRLYIKTYQAFNFIHFKEMLEERENITISYTALRRLLMNNGLQSPRIQRITKRKIKLAEVKKKKENKDKTEEELNELATNEIAIEDAHPRQEKPKYFGEVIEMDGSCHVWFGEKKTTLHLAIDKCSNTIVGGYFDKQETLNGYYNVFSQILSNYGIPAQFNTDNRTVFNYEKLNESKRTSEKDVLTQFGYACKSLGVTIQTSNVPQSKGLIEKTNGTFQDRMINEMKLDGIDTIEEANKYLKEIFIDRFNKRFSLDYTKFDSVMESIPTKEKINYTLAVMTPRVVDSGHSIKYKNDYYRMYKDDKLVCYTRGTKCLVIKALDGQLLVSIEDTILELRKVNKHKTTSDFDATPVETKKDKKPYIPPMSHPWRLSSFTQHQNKVKATKTYA